MTKANTDLINAQDAQQAARRIGQILLEFGVLTPEELNMAIIEQEGTGKRIGQVLLDLGILAERDLARAVAEQGSIPYVDLRSESPDEDAIAKIPESLARKYNALGMRAAEKEIEVVFAEPTVDAIEELKAATGLEILPAVAAKQEVSRAIDGAYRVLSGLSSLVTSYEESTVTRTNVAAAETETADDAPVVQVVNLIVTQALRDRASDIHIEPQESKIRVRFRIDGALKDAASLPSNMGPALVSRLKVLADMNIVEKRRPQDGQIAMDIDGQSVDIRVSTTATVWGEKAVLRILDKRRSLYSLDMLGMSTATHALMSKLVRQPFGMVICAGPTGSGKTTTLYAALAEINRPERNIMTIEDPVEYIVSSINQIQINEQAGITFAGGLKSILRQDPDVILVGEIRDVETARIAVQSALTGHFVLSSLHATDAVSALFRFLDMGLESFLIASSVNAVVGQRLLRRMCNACKAPYQPSAEEIEFYVQSGGPLKEDFWRGQGCNFCAHTGFQDRIGVYEVLVVSNEIKDAIVHGATADAVRAFAINEGMTQLREEAVRLVAEDVTTIDEVLRTIYSV